MNKESKVPTEQSKEILRPEVLAALRRAGISVTELSENMKRAGKVLAACGQPWKR